jgi:hypothetical protein
MRTCLFVLVLGLAVPAWAQELPDSGLPDGGVETGSAQGNTEENDPNAGPCLVAKDCAQGFSCVNERCVPAKTKNAGCGAVPGAGLMAGALVLALRRRRS